MSTRRQSKQRKTATSSELLPPLATESTLVPQKKELYSTFMQTLQKVLPHLGKDESKIISSLIILALKLEGIIGKDLTDDDSKLIEILKSSIMNNDDQKNAALMLAESVRKNLETPQ